MNKQKTINVTDIQAEIYDAIQRLRSVLDHISSPHCDTDADRHGIYLPECTIITCAAERYYMVTHSAIFGRTRKAHIVWPRMVAMYACSLLTNASTESLGKWWGRNGATIRHDVQTVRDRLDTEPQARAEVEYFLTLCKADLEYHRRLRGRSQRAATDGPAP